LGDRESRCGQRENPLPRKDCTIVKEKKRLGKEEVKSTRNHLKDSAGDNQKSLRGWWGNPGT